MQVASFDDAQAQAAFPLRDPRGLGSPRIFISGTDATWFVYDAPEYGRIWVGEGLPDIQDDAERLASYQEIVAENGQPGRSSRGEMVTVRGHDLALVGTSEDAPATLEWVEKGVQFVVQGPTLSRDQAIAIANEL